MDISGEYRIPAPQQRVWDALNDPDILRRSLPGCRALDQTGEHEFTATVTARIGPVSATFKGKVELADLDPPNGYLLSGRGQGGPAGFAKGNARVSLEADGAETILRYTADIDVGGKLAAVGGRLIGGVAKSMADEFFGAFVSAVIGADEPAATARATASESGSSGQRASAPQPRPVSVNIARPAVNIAGSSFLFVDRLAWLVTGMAVGVLATLRYMGRL